MRLLQNTNKLFKALAKQVTWQIWHELLEQYHVKWAFWPTAGYQTPPFQYCITSCELNRKTLHEICAVLWIVESLQAE